MGKAKPKTYRKERNHSNFAKFRNRLKEVHKIITQLKSELKINSETK